MDHGRQKIKTFLQCMCDVRTLLSNENNSLSYLNHVNTPLEPFEKLWLKSAWTENHPRLNVLISLDRFLGHIHMLTFGMTILFFKNERRRNPWHCAGLSKGLNRSGWPDILLNGLIDGDRGSANGGHNNASPGSTVITPGKMSYR